MILDKKKALVVFSGGQDSTTCLFWAKKHFDQVYALCFRYGQKHVKEVDIARGIAEKAGVPFEEKDVSFISQLSSGCSLTDSSITMDKEKTKAGITGIEIAARIIKECKPYCQGVHIMALGWESKVPALLKLAEI